MKKAPFIQLALAFMLGPSAFWLPIVVVRMIFGDPLGVLLTIVPLTLSLPVVQCLVLELLG